MTVVVPFEEGTVPGLWAQEGLLRSKKGSVPIRIGEERENTGEGGTYLLCTVVLYDVVESP